MPIISSNSLCEPIKVGNVPFRKLAWQFGAGLVVSEMVASQALVEGEGEMHLKMQAGDLPQHVLQIAGREALWMALAAKMAQDNGAQIIDINMGCPAKRVTNGYSGLALMRDLDHALTLIDAVVAAVEIPVTLKMRLGWDHNSLNAADLAKRAEGAGVQMITVHGRTRCQFYKGEADWNAVRAVREAVDVPLVVNGDIVGLASAHEALRKSNADAVIIGRGPYGAPWLPGEVVCGTSDDAFSLTGDFVKQHHDEMHSFYGIGSGIRQARKHLGWYLEHLPKSQISGSDKKLMTSIDPAEIHRLIDQIFANCRVTNKLAKAAA